MTQLYPKLLRYLIHETSREERSYLALNFADLGPETFQFVVVEGKRHSDVSVIVLQSLKNLLKGQENTI